MTTKRFLLLGVIAALVAAYLALDLGQYASLQYLKAQHATLHHRYQAHPVQMALAFFALYVAVTASSLPGAALLTLSAGAIFGLAAGTVVVSFASSLGATLAFLASRFLLRDMVQNRFGSRLNAVNRGVEREGAFYLFTLRLVPAFPFFVVNLAMGLTPIRTATFYLVSQAGMLAGTIVYVNAGTQLAAIQSLSGILSPSLILSFSLLGVFPLLAKKLLDVLKAGRQRGGYPKPKTFDRNMVVIGTGSGGLLRPTSQPRCERK